MVVTNEEQRSELKVPTYVVADEVRKALLRVLQGLHRTVSLAVTSSCPRVAVHTALRTATILFRGRLLRPKGS